MTPEAIDIAIKALTLLLSVGAMLFAWLRTRGKIIDDRMEAMARDIAQAVRAGSERIDRQDRRLQSVEQTMHGMPGREDLHGLQLEMARVAGSIQTMQAVIEGNQQIMRRMEAVVTRHEEHLLEKGR